MVVEGMGANTSDPLFNTAISRLCPLAGWGSCYQTCGLYTWRDGHGICAIRAIAEELMSKKVKV